MTTPSSRLEALQSAAQSVLGRMVCFCVACSLGCGVGWIIDHWDMRDGESFFTGLLLALAVVPVAFVSVLTSCGLVVFPVCLLIAFIFIRFELPFWWLFMPFVLTAWQTVSLRFAW